MRPLVKILPAGLWGLSTVERGLEPERLRGARQKSFEYAAWPGLLRMDCLMQQDFFDGDIWNVYGVQPFPGCWLDAS